MTLNIIRRGVLPLLSFLLVLSGINGQVTLSTLGGSLTDLQVAEIGPDTFKVTGNYNDPTQISTGTNLTKGDILWSPASNPGDTCRQYTIDSVLLKFSGYVEFQVVDINNSGPPSTENSYIIRGTPTRSLAFVPDDGNGGLLECISRHFSLQVDTITTGGSAGPQTIDLLTYDGDTLSISLTQDGNVYKVSVKPVNSDSITSMDIVDSVLTIVTADGNTYTDTINVTANVTYFTIDGGNQLYISVNYGDTLSVDLSSLGTMDSPPIIVQSNTPFNSRVFWKNDLDSMRVQAPYASTFAKLAYLMDIENLLDSLIDIRSDVQTISNNVAINLDSILQHRTDINILYGLVGSGVVDADSITNFTIVDSIWTITTADGNTWIDTFDVYDDSAILDSIASHLTRIEALEISVSNNTDTLLDHNSRINSNKNDLLIVFNRLANGLDSITNAEIAEDSILLVQMSSGLEFRDTIRGVGYDDQELRDSMLAHSQNILYILNRLAGQGLDSVTNLQVIDGDVVYLATSSGNEFFDTVKISNADSIIDLTIDSNIVTITTADGLTWEDTVWIDGEVTYLSLVGSVLEISVDGTDTMTVDLAGLGSLSSPPIIVQSGEPSNQRILWKDSDDSTRVQAPFGTSGFVQLAYITDIVELTDSITNIRNDVNVLYDTLANLVIPNTDSITDFTIVDTIWTIVTADGNTWIDTFRFDDQYLLDSLASHFQLISINKDSIDSHYSLIMANTSNIATNTTNISNNTDSINLLLSDVDSIFGVLDTMKQILDVSFSNGNLTIVTSDSTYTINFDQSIEKIWYVAEGGNNSEAVEGNINYPLADPWTAVVDSASAGDLVVILGGDYTGSPGDGNLFKDSVTIVGIGGPTIRGGGVTDNGNDYLFLSTADGDRFQVFGTTRFYGEYLYKNKHDNTNVIINGDVGRKIVMEEGSENAVLNFDFTTIAQDTLRPTVTYNWLTGTDSIKDNTVNINIGYVDAATDYFVDLNNPYNGLNTRNNITVNIKDITSNLASPLIAANSTGSHTNNERVTFNIGTGRFTSTLFGTSLLARNYENENSNPLYLTINCDDCYLNDVKLLGGDVLKNVDVTVKGKWRHINTLSSRRFIDIQDVSDGDKNKLLLQAQVEVTGDPVVTIDSSARMDFIMFGSYLKRNDNGVVVGVKQGPATGKEYKWMASFFEGISGNTFPVVGGTGGTIEQGALYNADNNTQRDEDLTFIRIENYDPEYPTDNSVRSALPDSSYVVDGNGNEFRLDTLSDFNIQAADTIRFKGDSAKMYVNVEQLYLNVDNMISVTNNSLKGVVAIDSDNQARLMTLDSLFANTITDIDKNNDYDLVITTPDSTYTIPFGPDVTDAYLGPGKDTAYIVTEDSIYSIIVGYPRLDTSFTWTGAGDTTYNFQWALQNYREVNISPSNFGGDTLFIQIPSNPGANGGICNTINILGAPSTAPIVVKLGGVNHRLSYVRLDPDDTGYQKLYDPVNSDSTDYRLYNGYDFTLKWKIRYQLRDEGLWMIETVQDEALSTIYEKQPNIDNVEQALDTLFDRNHITDVYSTSDSLYIQSSDSLWVLKTSSFKVLDTFITTLNGTIDLTQLCQDYDAINIAHRMLTVDADSQITYILPDPSTNFRCQYIRFSGRTYNGQPDAMIFDITGSVNFISYGNFEGSTGSMTSDGNNKQDKKIFTGLTYSPTDWYFVEFIPYRSGEASSTYYWMINDRRTDARHIDYDGVTTNTVNAALDTLFDAIDTLIDKNHIVDVSTSPGNITVVTEDSTYTLPIAGIDFGNIWYVATGGDNNNGEKGNQQLPLADPWAAVDSAVAGDLIIVNPGTYTDGGVSNLWKNNVNILFIEGAVISGPGFAQFGSPSGYFYVDDSNSGEEMTVYGKGDFTSNNVPLLSSDSSSNVAFFAEVEASNAIAIDAGTKSINTNLYIENATSKNYLIIYEDSAQDSIIDNKFSYHIKKMTGHGYFVDFNGSNNDNLDRNELRVYIEDVRATNAGGDRGWFADASVSKRFVGWNVAFTVENGYFEQYNQSFDYNVFGGAYYKNNSVRNQYTIDCGNCTYNGAVRPIGDFYYSGWNVVFRGNHFYNSTTGQAAINLSSVQSSPAQKGQLLVDANVYMSGGPIINVNNGSQQSAILSGFFKRSDDGPVINYNNGVGGGNTFVLKDLTIQGNDSTTIYGTGGTIYLAGFHDNTTNYEIDPDINYVPLPNYLEADDYPGAITDIYSSGDSVYINTSDSLYGVDVGLMVLDTTINHLSGGNVTYDFTYAANNYDIINVSVVNNSFGDIVSVVIPDYSTSLRVQRINLATFHIPGSVIAIDGNRISNVKLDDSDMKLGYGTDTTLVFYVGSTYFPESYMVYKYTGVKTASLDGWLVENFKNNSHNIAYEENGVNTVNQALDSLFNKSSNIGSRVYFSLQDGNDTTGVRGDLSFPFRTPWAAYDAAESGDVLIGLAQDTFILNGNQPFSYDDDNFISEDGEIEWEVTKNITFNFFPNSAILLDTVEYFGIGSATITYFDMNNVSILTNVETEIGWEWSVNLGGELITPLVKLDFNFLGVNRSALSEGAFLYIELNTILVDHYVTIRELGPYSELNADIEGFYNISEIDVNTGFDIGYANSVIGLESYPNFNYNLNNSLVTAGQKSNLLVKGDLIFTSSLNCFACEVNYDLDVVNAEIYVEDIEDSKINITGSVKGNILELEDDISQGTSSLIYVDVCENSDIFLRDFKGIDLPYNQLLYLSSSIGSNFDISNAYITLDSDYDSPQFIYAGAEAVRGTLNIRDSYFDVRGREPVGEGELGGGEYYFGNFAGDYDYLVSDVTYLSNDTSLFAAVYDTTYLTNFNYVFTGPIETVSEIQSLMGNLFAESFDPFLYISNFMSNVENPIHESDANYLGYLSNPSAEDKLEYDSVSLNTTDNNISLTGHGQGNKTASELGKTESAYVAGFATDGTIIDVQIDSLTSQGVSNFYKDQGDAVLVTPSDTFRVNLDSLNFGNIVYFSKELGDNSTGQRGNLLKPFADPWAAYGASQEGDVIQGLTVDTFYFTYGDIYDPAGGVGFSVSNGQFYIEFEEKSLDLRFVEGSQYVLDGDGSDYVQPFGWAFANSKKVNIENIGFTVINEGPFGGRAPEIEIYEDDSVHLHKFKFGDIINVRGFNMYSDGISNLDISVKSFEANENAYGGFWEIYPSYDGGVYNLEIEKSNKRFDFVFDGGNAPSDISKRNTFNIDYNSQAPVGIEYIRIDSSSINHSITAGNVNIKVERSDYNTVALDVTGNYSPEPVFLPESDILELDDYSDNNIASLNVNGYFGYQNLMDINRRTNNNQVYVTGILVMEGPLDNFKSMITIDTGGVNNEIYIDNMFLKSDGYLVNYVNNDDGTTDLGKLKITNSHLESSDSNFVYQINDTITMVNTKLYYSGEGSPTSLLADSSLYELGNIANNYPLFDSNDDYEDHISWIVNPSLEDKIKNQDVTIDGNGLHDFRGSNLDQVVFNSNNTTQFSSINSNVNFLATSGTIRFQGQNYRFLNIPKYQEETDSIYGFMTLVNSDSAKKVTIPQLAQLLADSSSDISYNSLDTTITSADWTPLPSFWQKYDFVNVRSFNEGLADVQVTLPAPDSSFVTEMYLMVWDDSDGDTRLITGTNIIRFNGSTTSNLILEDGKLYRVAPIGARGTDNTQYYWEVTEMSGGDAYNIAYNTTTVGDYLDGLAGEASLTLDTVLYQGQDWSPTIEFLSNYQIINITLKGNSVVSADSTVITLPEADTLLRNTVIKITGLTVSINSLPVVYFEDSDVSYYFDIVSDNGRVDKIDDVMVSSIGSSISNGSGIVASNERFYPAGYDYIIVYRDELEALEIPGIKLIQKGYSVYKRGSSPSSYNAYYNASESTTIKNVDQALDTLFLIAGQVTASVKDSVLYYTFANGNTGIYAAPQDSLYFVTQMHDALNRESIKGIDIVFQMRDTMTEPGLLVLPNLKDSVTLAFQTGKFVSVRNQWDNTASQHGVEMKVVGGEPWYKAGDSVYVDTIYQGQRVLLQERINQSFVNRQISDDIDYIYSEYYTDPDNIVGYTAPTELDSLLAKVDAETSDTFEINRPLLMDGFNNWMHFRPRSSDGYIGLTFESKYLSGATNDYNHSIGPGGSGLNIVSNYDSRAGLQEDASFPSWIVNQNPANDNFRITRSPAGSTTFVDLLTIEGDKFTWDFADMELQLQEDYTNKFSLVLRGGTDGSGSWSDFRIDNTAFSGNDVQHGFGAGGAGFNFFSNRHPSENILFDTDYAAWNINFNAVNDRVQITRFAPTLGTPVLDSLWSWYPEQVISRLDYIQYDDTWSTELFKLGEVDAGNRTILEMRNDGVTTLNNIHVDDNGRFLFTTNYDLDAAGQADVTLPSLDYGMMPDLDRIGWYRRAAGGSTWDKLLVIHPDSITNWTGDYIIRGNTAGITFDTRENGSNPGYTNRMSVGAVGFNFASNWDGALVSKEDNGSGALVFNGAATNEFFAFYGLPESDDVTNIYSTTPLATIGVDSNVLGVPTRILGNLTVDQGDISIDGGNFERAFLGEGLGVTGFSFKHVSTTPAFTLTTGTVGNGGLFANWNLNSNAQDDLTEASIGLGLNVANKFIEFRTMDAGTGTWDYLQYIYPDSVVNNTGNLIINDKSTGIQRMWMGDIGNSGQSGFRLTNPSAAFSNSFYTGGNGDGALITNWDLVNGVQDDVSKHSQYLVLATNDAAPHFRYDFRQPGGSSWEKAFYIYEDTISMYSNLFLHTPTSTRRSIRINHADYSHSTGFEMGASGGINQYANWVGGAQEDATISSWVAETHPVNDEFNIWRAPAGGSLSKLLTLTSTDFTIGSYVFNTDQTVGASQDNYILTYDNGTGEISLEAPALTFTVDSSQVLRDSIAALRADITSLEASVSDLQDSLNTRTARYTITNDSIDGAGSLNLYITADNQTFVFDGVTEDVVTINVYGARPGGSVYFYFLSDCSTTVTFSSEFYDRDTYTATGDVNISGKKIMSFAEFNDGTNSEYYGK
jgi:hypothetical protein